MSTFFDWNEFEGWLALRRIERRLTDQDALAIVQELIANLEREVE